MQLDPEDVHYVLKIPKIKKIMIEKLITNL